MSYNKTLIVGILAIIMSITLPILGEDERTIPLPEPIEILQVLVSYGPEYCVTGTFYNPVVEQCDDDPLVTADCSKIDLDDFPPNWIAVSRDLLKEYDFNYGDEVLIEHADSSICGIYEIHDTMNSRFSKKIDFLVPPGQKLGYGKWDNIKMKKIIKEPC